VRASREGAGRRIRSTLTVVLAASALALLPGCALGGDAGATAGQPGDDVVADASLTAWDDLKVGDCIFETDWDAQLDGGGVEVVDCDGEHTDELYAVVVHEVATFPGEEEILALADDACLQRFEGYVGSSHEEAEFDFSYTAPSEQSWEAGDRESQCFLFDFEREPRTGSARDAGL
jgi:hypothetical protein